MFAGRKRVAWLVEILQTVAITLVLFLGVRAAVVPRIVLGQSMEPTLHNNEWVLLERVSYWLHGPERGDIVVFKSPDNPTEDYIKRVIGLPGDHVAVDNGRVYVNGHQLAETYIAAPPDYSDDRVVTPGYLYVLGDNRDNSDDSHAWGLLPRANVVGRAWVSYWPLPDLSFLPHPSYGNIR